VTNDRISKTDRSNGYSLAELMTVIACASVLIVAAIPNILHWQKEWMLWGSARALENSLQWGRMHAIAANTPILFEIDNDRHKYYWVDPDSGDLYAYSIRYLAGGVRLTAFPRRSLRFYQHGNAAPGGTYTLEGETGSYSVVVSPGGRIRIQRN
jgi:Tfp pilus assembly protein FimT